MRIAALSFSSFALAAAAAAPQDCPMHAQHAAASATSAPVRSPYSDEQARAVKALSEADVKAYLEGTGLGTAKPAELNQYPGPRHVLDNGDALKLSEAQRAAVEASFRGMNAAAVALGRQVVDAETRLDALFAERTATPEAVGRLTRDLASLQGQLRAVHLNAHIEVRALLTPGQVEQYVALRGYGDGTHQGH